MSMAKQTGVRICSDVNLHYLANEISDLDNKTVIEFVKEIDGLMADYRFTKTLREYFVKEIKNEDAGRTDIK